MSLFERFLTLWVALCIVAGIADGKMFPSQFQTIGGLEMANINLPLAVLIGLMIILMLLKIDFAAMGQVTRHWRGVGGHRGTRNFQSRWSACVQLRRCANAGRRPGGGRAAAQACSNRKSGDRQC